MQILGQERKQMLIQDIINNTNKVAIGPLEYCGNGTVIHTTHNTQEKNVGHLQLFFMLLIKLHF